MNVRGRPCVSVCSREGQNTTEFGLAGGDGKKTSSHSTITPTTESTGTWVALFGICRRAVTTDYVERARAPTFGMATTKMPGETCSPLLALAFVHEKDEEDTPPGSATPPPQNAAQSLPGRPFARRYVDPRPPHSLPTVVVERCIGRGRCAASARTRKDASTGGIICGAFESPPPSGCVICGVAD